MPPIQPFEQHHFIFKSKVKESRRLAKCFLNYLRRDKNEVGVLFDMLSVFLVRNCIDYTFLKNFYMIEVAEEYNPQMKKALLVHFLHLFEFKEVSQDHLVVSMQMLILPMLAHSFQNNQSWDVVDASIINTIVEKLLDLPEEVSAEYDEPLRIELLQLSTLLLKYLPNDLVHYRKKLIKFGWNHLKQENSACRQWALVNVCHFVEAYQAPERIIVQVFVILLRTWQPENKVLVNQALDILMPALPRRLPVGGYKTPIWILCTRKILLEEGHSVPTLIHIFQLIVRHSDLFYSYRAELVPQIVNSLSLLGLPQNISPDNRRLALELAGLVIGWEKQCQGESKTITDSGHAQAMNMSISASVVEGELSGAATSLKRPTDSGFADELTKQAKTESGFSSIGVMFPSGTSIQRIGTPGADAQSDEEYKPNAAIEEMIINFLTGVTSATEPKDKEMSAMHKLALDLLSQASEVWPTANIKFNYLENLLSKTKALQQPLHRFWSATKEADVRDAFALSSLQQYWDKDVFLSHSGKQKNFVRQLYRDLTRQHVSCFFDEGYNSLPLDMWFPLILKAAETCRIAVLVISKEFICSRWPMLELSAFIGAIKSGKNANLKLLPIFFMITPKELSHITSSPEWQALRVSDDTICKWQNALKEVRSINGFQFDENGDEIQLRDEFVKQICCLLKRINPPHLLDFQPEADVSDAFALSSLQQHWDKDVVLSHSGKQKNFARQLYRDLTREHVSCFLDSTCLPLGERLPPLIFKAAETCRIAVLVLSKEFILSKWSMLELSALIRAKKSGKNANLKLLPIFFMIDPKELSHITKYDLEWQKSEVCNDTRGEWETALKEVRAIYGFKFDEDGNEIQLRDEVVKSICCLLK